MPRRKASHVVAPTTPVIPVVHDVFTDRDLIHLILDSRARIKSMVVHRAWMRSCLLTLSRTSQVNKFLHAYVIDYFETILAHLRKRRSQFQSYVLNGRASEAPYIPKRLRLNAHAVLLQLSDEHGDTVTEDLWEDGARTPCADTMPMLAARLAPRCLCCRLNTVPPLMIYGNCQSCVRAEHLLSYQNCAGLYHPYTGYLNDSVVYYYKLPYTSSRHLVSVIITRMTDTNGNESLDAHVDVSSRPCSNEDDRAKGAIRTMKAMGKLQQRLQRIYDKRHALRLAMVDPTVEMVEEHGFSIVLPLQRLLYDGIGMPDCSFAEVFGLSDAEIDAYAKLGKDIMVAEGIDEISTAEDNRVKVLKEYVFDLERMGSGGAIWKRADDGRLVIEANGEHDSAPLINAQWFKTWKLAPYFLTPITTSSKARRWTKLMHLFQFAGKQNMNIHFQRIEQLVGMALDNHNLSPCNERAVRAMASEMILCIPRMAVLPHNQWNGNIQSSAGKGIHCDLIFRHLLFNVLHTKRLIVAVSQVLVNHPRTLRDSAMILDLVQVRMSIASGGGLQSGTAHHVRLFGVVTLKEFLEMLRSERKTDDRILAFFNGTNSPAKQWDLARLYTELNSVCDDVSKDIMSCKTRVLQFLSTVMLKGQVWMTEPFASVQRNAPRVFFRNKKDFYDPDVRPFCEAQGFDKCYCQSRCTFSGRRSHQCVFGQSKQTLSQAELPF